LHECATCHSFPRPGAATPKPRPAGVWRQLRWSQIARWRPEGTTPALQKDADASGETPPALGAAPPCSCQMRRRRAQTTPKRQRMASATFLKPPMLAPFT
jgi:hypothetical protein